MSCLAPVRSDKIVAKVVGIILEMKVSSSRAIIHMQVAIESGMSVTWRRRRGSRTPAI
jgi:hypothetical protein